MKNLLIILFSGVILSGCVFMSEKSLGNLPSSEETKVVNLNDGDEYTLEAGYVTKNIRGKELKMLAYNKSIPGPLIKVDQGSEITINFKNNTDLETTIHSHGIRLDNQFDGVPDVTQEVVRPREEFSYVIKFPDAGIYWYHPHVREDMQQELGLYGNFLVNPATDNFWNPVNREEVLVLDDLKIDNDGEIVKFKQDVADHAIMGRFGNVMLLNGETNYMLDIKKNEVVRFYLTNVANTRTFNLMIPGVRLKLVGGDSGVYENESWQDSIVISPSERVVVEAYFEESGKYVWHHMAPGGMYNLGTIRVSNEIAVKNYSQSHNKLRTNQTLVDELKEYRKYVNSDPDKKLTLSIEMPNVMSNMDHSMMEHHSIDHGAMNHGDTVMDDTGGIEWEDQMGHMNVISTSDIIEWKFIDQETGKENMNIDWKFKVGDKVKIRIFNDPESMHPMQHPIHFHGQRFLVLSIDGEENDNMVWKDTVLIKTGDTVDLLLDISNPGEWMVHCHIAEHLTSGMMFRYSVE